MEAVHSMCFLLLLIIYSFHRVIHYFVVICLSRLYHLSFIVSILFWNKNPLHSAYVTSWRGVWIVWPPHLLKLWLCLPSHRTMAYIFWDIDSMFPVVSEPSFVRRKRCPPPGTQQGKIWHTLGALMTGVDNFDYRGITISVRFVNWRGSTS